jgi:glycosyltransferase involved in cell wall biosynthesis
MRIVQTPVRFYPYIGGVENFVYELSKALVSRGHGVRIICSDEGQEGKQQDMDVKALPYAFKVANTNITPSLPFALREESYDIMHTHMPTPYTADVSTYVSKMRDKPVVLTYHNDIVAHDALRVVSSAYNRILMPCLLRTVDAVTVSTDIYKKKLKEKFPETRGKMEVIPPGIDTEHFKPAERQRHDRKKAFFLSVLDEFHRYKGLDYLLEAVRGLDIELVVAGAGKLLDEYRKKAGENVIFLGRISEEEKIRRYQSSDIFVLPSTSAEQEGFGIVALEALACGTPVIVSSIVGMAEDVRKNGCGIVVPPGDVNALREAMMSFEPSPKERENARNLSLQYSWQRIAGLFEELYRRVMN